MLSNRFVTIHVDDRKFVTQKSTLRRYPLSKLAKIVNNEIDEDEFMFYQAPNLYIDRSARSFEYILSLFRNYDLNIEDMEINDEFLKQEIINDLEYYNLKKIEDTNLFDTFVGIVDQHSEKSPNLFVQFGGNTTDTDTNSVHGVNLNDYLVPVSETSQGDQTISVNFEDLQKKMSEMVNDENIKQMLRERHYALLNDDESDTESLDLE